MFLCVSIGRRALSVLMRFCAAIVTAAALAHPSTAAAAITATPLVSADAMDQALPRRSLSPRRTDRYRAGRRSPSAAPVWRGAWSGARTDSPAPPRSGRRPRRRRCPTSRSRRRKASARTVNPSPSSASRTPAALAPRRRPVRRTARQPSRSRRRSQDRS